MEITDEKIKKATEVFCRNPYWKKLYYEAPPGAKRWYELHWCGTEFNDEIGPEEFIKARKAVNKSLTNADIDYLMKDKRCNYKGMILRQIQADRASEWPQTMTSSAKRLSTDS